jgi:HAD superfamily hydrolase (TIGR01549 family)
MGKRPHKHLILNFDLYIWDKDGTCFNHKDPKVTLYPGLSKILMQIPKQKQAMITNADYPEGYLKAEKIYEYFNPELIINAGEEIEKIILNQKHPYQEKFNLTGIYGKDLATISPYVSKPGTYMFEQILEKTKINPSRCVMIGDGCEDIIAASYMGINTIYLNGLESKDPKNFTVHNLKLQPTHRIHAGDMAALEKILFG